MQRATPTEPKKKKATKAKATTKQRCTNCGQTSHSTVSCPFETKGGGLHNEDGTKIRLCSVCHKPGHTKRNCPELADFGTHNLPVEQDVAETLTTVENILLTTTLNKSALIGAFSRGFRGSA